MTLDELKNSINNIRERIAHLSDFLDIESRESEIREIEAKMSLENFWDNKEDAQATVAKLSSCKQVIEPLFALQKDWKQTLIAISHNHICIPNMYPEF